MKIKLADLKKFGIFLLIPLAIFSFLIFQTKAASQADAIGVRVMPNPEHSSIADWYAKQGLKGTPQSLIVDGYEAIRDGRTVFVNAANVDLAASKLYTNVYLISFNQESENNTVDILGQLVSHWKFNNNILTPGQCSISNKNCQADSECPKDYICSNSSAQANFGKCILKDNKACLIDSDCPVNLFCDSLKAKVTRDVKRLGELNNIRGAIETFKNNNSAYPSLNYATYVAGSSLSLWPSWKDTLLSQIRITTQIVDPINSLGYCDKYDPITCWNKDTNEFVNPNLVLPYGSYAYIYRATQNGVNYNLCAVFESKAAGIDTAEGQFTANSCAVGQGYGGSDSNTAPVVTSSYTDGETGKEFAGAIKAKDAEGDLILWKLTPVASSWPSWSAAPILKDGGNANQKQLYAATAGRSGTYKMLLTLTDSRGAVSNTELTINIGVAGRPLIEADNIDYFVDPVNSLNYTFYIQGSNSVPTQYTFSPVNSGANQAINAQIAKAAASLNNMGINRVKVDLIITFPPGMSIPQDITIPYRISSTVGGATATKDIDVNLRMEQPYLNFECENMARLGQPYQISDTGKARSCLIGNLKSGNHTISYGVSGADGLTIRNDATDLNAYLEASPIGGTAGDKQITVKAVNEYGATTIKSFILKVNTFCGDGQKQRPNTEGRGGFNNDGIEECDGISGVTYNVSTSSSLQYGCTTDYAKSPYPILDNKSCVFKPAASGGGYCGDGYCQFNVVVNGQARQIENCDNCAQDCGKCACVPKCDGKTCGDDGCGGVCGECGANEACTNNACCPVKADIQVCADNEHQTYFNGVFVGSGRDWANVEKFNVEVRPGKNVMAINATDWGAIYGFSATLNQGICKSMTTDDVKNWKCINAKSKVTSLDNWYAIDYDDSLWTAPSVPITGTKGIRPGNYLEYQQIWASDAMAEKTSVYCRYTFSTIRECMPNCTGKKCGSDGCGGSCGICDTNKTCSTSGACVCAASCAGKTCGSNGCGDICGTCPAGQTCSASGNCACVPNCSGKKCGDNGCGGTCGPCASDESCSSGACVKNCVPNCSGKNCGDDGCGGSCGGTCPSGQACSSGVCVATCDSSCAGKQCGLNGCGSSCGTCLTGTVCSATGTCEQLSCTPGYYGSYGYCQSCSTYTYYCPGGAPALQYSVDSGYYSTGGTPSNRTGQAICPAGSWCSSGQIAASCPAGYYCPVGTSYETVWSHPCPNGTINPSGGGSSASDCTACGSGKYSCFGISCFDNPRGSICTW